MIVASLVLLFGAEISWCKDNFTWGFATFIILIDNLYVNLLLLYSKLKIALICT